MLAHYCRFIDKAALTKPDPFAVPVIELSPTVAVTFMGSVPVDERVAEKIRLCICAGDRKRDSSARSGNGAVSGHSSAVLVECELDRVLGSAIGHCARPGALHLDL